MSTRTPEPPVAGEAAHIPPSTTLPDAPSGAASSAASPAVASRESTEKDAVGGAGPNGRLGFLDRLSEGQATGAVLLFGCLLLLPFAGSYGLFDPWETHYGEVARQMAKRGDAISLWWPGAPTDPDTFWSKPVLSFWIMALSLRLFGLAGGGPASEMALGTRAEWALRLPFCLFGVMGLYAVYLCLSRLVSRRAGVLAALVLGTSPLYSLVARQAMTDMAFVGPMALALSLGMLALLDDRDAELPRRHVRFKRWAFSWPRHPAATTTFLALGVVVLPQLVIDSVQLTWRLPGRQGMLLSGFWAMLPAWVGLGAALVLVARTRYLGPFYLYLAAVLCGLAVLAKGLAGLGLPVIIFVLYLASTWSWRRMGRAQLVRGVLVAFLLCALVAVPWHEAMLLRHGFPFWDELYGDNHWRRLVLGRHGDRGTFEYFLRELGYAVLPWIALAPAALLLAVTKIERSSRRQAMFWFGALWFVSAYALVSLSVTKFHHYILPALPGLAMALGCVLDDLLDRRSHRALGAAAFLGVPLMLLAAHDLFGPQNGAQRFIWLFSYDYINQPKGRDWPPFLDFRPALVFFSVWFALGAALFAWPRLRRAALATVVTGAVAFTFYLLDGALPRMAHAWSQKPLIATYYRTRSSPAEKLLVWQMYWRGENFYTSNEIYEGPKDDRTIFLGDRNAEHLQEWMARHKGTRAFLLVERSRQAHLKSLLPEYARGSLRLVDESNMKFGLYEVQL